MASRRILDLLASRGIRATWFIPGFTIESWPRECSDVVAGGHEVAHHSWAHIPPATQTRDEEEADLVRANDAIANLSGRKARGYRSPSWDLSEHTIDLLLRHGFQYDSSLMGADYLPYRARRGDVAKLGEPFHFGEETAIIEMPISWSLDDFPHFEFMRTATTDPARSAAGACGPAELARRIPLHEEVCGVGCAHLHHASLCDRPRLSNAGARRLGRSPYQGGRRLRDDGRGRPAKRRTICPRQVRGHRERGSHQLLSARSQFPTFETHLRKSGAILTRRHARMPLEQITEKADVLVSGPRHRWRSWQRP